MSRVAPAAGFIQLPDSRLAGYKIQDTKPTEPTNTSQAIFFKCVSCGHRILSLPPDFELEIIP
jgi:hypothetical protein